MKTEAPDPESTGTLLEAFVFCVCGLTLTLAVMSFGSLWRYRPLRPWTPAGDGLIDVILVVVIFLLLLALALLVLRFVRPATAPPLAWVPGLGFATMAVALLVSALWFGAQIDADGHEVLAIWREAAVAKGVMLLLLGAVGALFVALSGLVLPSARPLAARIPDTAAAILLGAGAVVLAGFLLSWFDEQTRMAGRIGVDHLPLGLGWFTGCTAAAVAVVLVAAVRSRSPGRGRGWRAIAAAGGLRGAVREGSSGRGPVIVATWVGSAVVGCAALAFAGGLDLIAETVLRLEPHCTPKDLEEGIHAGMMLVLCLPVFLAARMLAASLERTRTEPLPAVGRTFRRLGTVLLVFGTVGLLVACVRWWIGLAGTNPRFLAFANLQTGATFLRFGAIAYLACATLGAAADNFAARVKTCGPAV